MPHKSNLPKQLVPSKALIFRITHIDNIASLLKTGVFAANHAPLGAGFTAIGHHELIVKRSTVPVPIPPGGVLADYVPFYFTPASPMLYNILTGRGVLRRSGSDIVVLVASLMDMKNEAVPYVFTDRHAYYEAACFYSDLDTLDQVLDWKRLQEMDFKRDPDDPGKFERYQAEALIHRHVPIEHLKGIVCYDQVARNRVEAEVAMTKTKLKIIAEPSWYPG